MKIITLRDIQTFSNMDNASKEYVNIERLSSGDIFSLLDLIENNDEGDIENIMNGSDTEFVAEDESVISTNIIRKEEVGDQGSSVSITEASIYILSIQNEDETDTLGQDELNSIPASQRISNQSPSPATQRTSNQSPSPANQHTVLSINYLLLPLNVLRISHLLLLLLDIHLISHPNLLIILQLLYPKTQRNVSKDQSSMLHPTRTTQTRKRTVSHKTKTRQRRKKPIRLRNGNGRIKKSL